MEFKKVNITKARRLYNEGITIYIVPCKVFPDFNNNWIKPFDLNIKEFLKENEKYNNFDSRINNFAYYNCNSELGNYIHFYIEVK
jgi:hypothetical protein